MNNEVREPMAIAEAAGVRPPGRVLFLLLSLLLLASCGPAEPSPTPTATRTPIVPTSTPTPTPTSTPTPTVTPTPTPTPTLPPNLVLPPTITPIDSCPPLPEDLFFLRQGRLQVCLTEGQAIETVPVAPDAEGTTVVDYRTASDRRYVAYVTDAGEMFLFDRAQQVHIFLPTSGRLLGDQGLHFELTADGSTLLYLAWGVQPVRGTLQVEEGDSGTLLSLELDRPTRRQHVLGFCQTVADGPCLGFSLSPDEAHMAIVDGHGVWTVPRRPPGPQRLVGVHGIGGMIRLRGWSPNGQWLLIESIGGAADTDTGAGPTLGLLRREAEAVPIETAPICSGPCELGTDWSQTALWLTWDLQDRGCLGHMELTETATLSSTTVTVTPAPLCASAPITLHPRSPRVIPDRGVTFLHRGSQDRASGLYAWDVGAADLQPLALLPRGDAAGTVLWSSQATAFLIVDPTGVASTLGVLTDGELWNVRGLLDGAHAFQWGGLAGESAVAGAPDHRR